MKVLLFNDTRIEKNPGCHATVNSLINFIKINIDNAIITTIPVGAEYSKFNIPNIYKKQGNRFLTKLYDRIEILNNSKNIPRIVNINIWKKIALNNFSTDIKNKIISSDLVVINMEGTIHHNKISALTLLGMAYYSKSLGKKVAMVNGSYQAMDIKLTKLALKNIDFIAAREPISYNYLKKYVKNVFLMPDLAFKASINNRINNCVFNEKNKCLYTPGVLSVNPEQNKELSINSIKMHITKIKDLGYIPYFLMIEPNEADIANELDKMGVEIISSYDKNIDYKNIGTLISKFELLITGRYHIAIFGLMSKVKTLLLPSNTKKIEGLLELINGQDLFINIELNNLKNKIDNLNMNKITEVNNDLYLPFKRFLNRV